MGKSIEKSDVITFLGGVAFAGAAVQFVKSRLAHKLAVKTMVGVLKAQDKATDKFEMIYEEAQDVYAEAKEQVAAPAKPNDGARRGRPKKTDAK
jgi:hypothetical protein